MIVFLSGELYRTAELQRELGGGGAAFRRGDDPELVLEAYLAHGPGFVKRIEGAFKAPDKWTQRFIGRVVCDCEMVSMVGSEAFAHDSEQPLCRSLVHRQRGRHLRLSERQVTARRNRETEKNSDTVASGRWQASQPAIRIACCSADNGVL